jgi:NAD-dependent SIR2 family protein deacetylase
MRACERELLLIVARRQTSPKVMGVAIDADADAEIEGLIEKIEEPRCSSCGWAFDPEYGFDVHQYLLEHRCPCCNMKNPLGETP